MQKSIKEMTFDWVKITENYKLYGDGTFRFIFINFHSAQTDFPLISWHTTHE